MFHRLDWFISSKRSVSSFSYTFSIPSSELRAAISNSKIASLAFLSRERNTMRVHFTFSTDMAISQICISFFHGLYLSVSKTGGEMYFKAIVPFYSAINVKLENNILILITKPQQQLIYGERIFIRPPLMTTVMVVSQLLVRSHLTAGRVFKGD